MATCVVRPTKLARGRGRSTARGWRKYLPSCASITPVSSAARIIGAASSKRSRDSSIEIPNWENSRRESPRPSPRIARPFDRWSSSAAFSATRSGWVFHGRITAPVARPMRSVRAARCARYTKLSGQKE